MGEALCAPSQPSSERKSYPCLYIDGGSELKDLPDSGTMTVRFSITNRSTNENVKNDEVKRSITVEVQEILDVDADESERKSPRKQAEDDLDRYMAEEADKD